MIISADVASRISSQSMFSIAEKWNGVWKKIEEQARHGHNFAPIYFSDMGTKEYTVDKSDFTHIMRLFGYRVKDSAVQCRNENDIWAWVEWNKID